MEKIIFADNTEIEIQGGASLSGITVIADNFAALQSVADTLLKEENLKKVKFATDETVTGEYADMKLEASLFRSVDVTGEGKVAAVFAIKEKTEIEKRLDILEARAEVTEEAVQEMIIANAEEVK